MGAFESRRGYMQRAEYEYMYNWLVVTLVVYNIRERGGNQTYMLDLCSVADKIGRCTCPEHHQKQQ